MEKLNDMLEPFAEIYNKMIKEISEDLEDYSHEYLEELIEMCDKPDDTNCWWAVYKVAPIVKLKAQLELAWRRNNKIDY